MSLADAFRDQIQVNFGIELGLQPQLAESFSGSSERSSL